MYFRIGKPSVAVWVCPVELSDYSPHFADYQLVIAEYSKDLEYMTIRVQDGHDSLCVALNLTKTKEAVP
jgi:hypothetical protein